MIPLINIGTLTIRWKHQKIWKDTTRVAPKWCPSYCEASTSHNQGPKQLCVAFRALRGAREGVKQIVRQGCGTWDPFYCLPQRSTLATWNIEQRSDELEVTRAFQQRQGQKVIDAKAERSQRAWFLFLAALWQSTESYAMTRSRATPSMKQGKHSDNTGKECVCTLRR